jgi:hypothetical protein
MAFELYNKKSKPERLFIFFNLMIEFVDMEAVLKKANNNE